MAAIIIAVSAVPVYYGKGNTGQNVEVYPIPLVNQADLKEGKPSKVMVPESVDDVEVLKIPVSPDKLSLLVDSKNSAEVSNLDQGKKSLRIVNEDGKVLYSYDFLSNGSHTKEAIKNNNSLSDKSQNLLSKSNMTSPLKVDGISISVVESEVVGAGKEVKRELLIAVASPEASPTQSLSVDSKNIRLVLDQKTGNPVVLTFSVPSQEPSSTPVNVTTQVPTSRGITTPTVAPTSSPTRAPNASQTSTPSITGTSTVRPTGSSSPSQTPYKHMDCSAGKCVQFDGPGPNKCFGDNDCVYKKCLQNGTCSSVPGSGKDLCLIDQECSHTKCVGFPPKCIRYLGQGVEECRTDENCARHKECKIFTCDIIPTKGLDECSKDSQCSHKECVNGICMLTIGGGPDLCSEDAQCKHKECVGGYCKAVDSVGADKCTSHNECGHNDCTFSGYCRRYFSAGSDKCKKDRDCSWLPGVGNYPEKKSLGRLSSSNDSYDSIESEKISVNPIATFVSDFAKPSYISDNAKAKIEIFQDVNCGMCKYAYKNMYAGMINDYVLKGLVSLDIKEFPLIPREKDLTEARALICAGEQNKYGAYLDKVYNWDTKKEPNRDLNKIAEDIKLNIELFNKCIISEETAAKLQSNIDEGKKRGIDGTPTIYLNGKQIGGAMDFEKLKDLVDKELNK